MSIFDLPQDSYTKLDINMGANSIPFYFPNSQNQVVIMEGILGNKTYPFQPFMSNLIDCTFDIGANSGIASLFFYFVTGGGVVHAYEPNTLNYPFLLENTKNYPNIHTYEYGLFHETTDIPIHISGAGGEESSVKTKGKVYQNDSPTIHLKDALSELEVKAGNANNILLKIDTEGCEVDILNRIAPLLPRVAVIYLEFHSEKDRRALDEILAGHDFTLFSSQISHPHRGEVFYVQTAILDEKTDYAQYIID